MRKIKGHQPRSLRFRLLLVAAGALLLMAALTPRANADVIAYFNFEDPVVTGGVDFQSDLLPGIGAGDNPGGGVVDTMMTSTYNTGDDRTGVGVMQNRTPGDIDNPLTLGSGMVLSNTSANNGATLDIALTPNTVGKVFTNMTLSFAVASAGNGFTTATIQINTGSGFTTVFTSPLIPPNAITIVTAPLGPNANNAPNLTVRIVLTGGTSSGNNPQSVIDNVRVDGTIVPEPTTVAGGLLGVLGLCWLQRRRLRSLLPRSRRA